MGLCTMASACRDFIPDTNQNSSRKNAGSWTQAEATTRCGERVRLYVIDAHVRVVSEDGEFIGETRIDLNRDYMTPSEFRDLHLTRNQTQAQLS
jgi:hypothetical protein